MERIKILDDYPSDYAVVIFMKFPAKVIKLIPTRRKLIVKLADGQIRYMVKRKNKFKKFSYNT